METKEPVKYPDMKPYYLRMFWQFINDQLQIPHIAVDVTYPNVQVPMEFVKDGRIFLSISEAACKHLCIDNDAIAFEGRFGGKVQQCYIPMDAIASIFARDDIDLCCMFQQPPHAETVDTPPAEPEPVKRDRSHLTVVK